MHTQAYDFGTKGTTPQEPGRAELLESVMTLRRDLNSIAADVRQVLTENERLKSQLSRANGRSGNKGRVSEINRMKQELDQLLAMHEMAASQKRQIRPAPVRDEMRDRDAGDSAWMKKMMMVMMLAEMV